MEPTSRLALTITDRNGKVRKYFAQRMETLDPYIAEIKSGEKWELTEEVNGKEMSIVDEHFWEYEDEE